MLTRVTLAVFLALHWAFAWPQADPALVAKLRQGGYVLYLRHASTDFSQNDERMTSFEDCAYQRNLTDKGRDEARAIRAHIKRLGIPIGPVHASPFCRTMETARLAFGRAERTNEARGGPANTNDPTRYEPLRQLMAKKPPAGQNAVISSHGNPFYAVFGPPYLAEGEMAVVQPSGFAVIGRIRLTDWQAFD
jgi:phosphohistidine phosphatase SixA